uniref:Uncharacterized protein n=1 Tax=Lotus japonicus TaxID=34305 RepID=I3T802_LOTJA|nr:unknown [Lotus japonicus]
MHMHHLFERNLKSTAQMSLKLDHPVLVHIPGCLDHLQTQY